MCEKKESRKRRKHRFNKKACKKVRKQERQQTKHGHDHICIRVGSMNRKQNLGGGRTKERERAARGGESSGEGEAKGEKSQSTMNRQQNVGENRRRK